MIAVYWKPVYKHIRMKWNRGNEEAKDLVQGFFAALLQEDLLARFDPSVESFRTHLRACVDRFALRPPESFAPAGRLHHHPGIAFSASMISHIFVLR